VAIAEVWIQEYGERTYKRMEARECSNITTIILLLKCYKLFFMNITGMWKGSNTNLTSSFQGICKDETLL